MRKWVVAAVLVVGIVLRLRGVFTDFWLDEIWGLRIALAAPSQLALITQIHADTNHPLVSMYMRTIGAVRHWEWYRLLSLACGIGTIFLVRDRMYRILAALSFPLIVYSSEARGYAPAAFFLLLAYTTRKRAVFGIAIILAILSHLSAIAVYLGFLAVDVAPAARRLVMRRPAASGETPRSHPAWTPALLLPLTFCVFYFFVKVRHLVPGGGPRWTPELFPIAIGVITLAVVVAEIVRRARARDAEALFFAVAIIAGPLVAAASYRCPCVLPRHFFVVMPFVLILFASFFERYRWGIALFVLLNAIQIVPFAVYGRGQYDRALHDVAGTVGGDSAMRDQMLIDFYNPSLRYVPRAQKPEWLLMESKIAVPGYTFFREYPYGGVSGWTWYVYRRDWSNPASIHK